MRSPLHTDARRRFLIGAALLPVAASLRMDVNPTAPGLVAVPGDALLVDHPAGGRVRLEPFANRLSRVESPHDWLYARSGAASGALNRPRAVAVGPGGDVWVANGGNDELLRFDADGRLVGTRCGLRVPRGLAVDAAGFVYVAERLGHRVSIFTPDGAPAGFLDASLEAPMDVAVLAGGVVAVAEPSARRVTLVEAGTVRRVALEDEPVAVAALPSGALAVATARQIHVVDPAAGARRVLEAPGRVAGLTVGLDGALRVQVLA
jgi:DNA-binding beta-propeller fold protein YncE